MSDTTTHAMNALISDQTREIHALRAENADLKFSVIAFGTPWAVERANDHGLPPRHLHAVHYDILAKAGARMVDFVRHDGGVAE
jgi:hypothetical protein